MFYIDLPNMNKHVGDISPRLISLVRIVNSPTVYRYRSSDADAGVLLVSGNVVDVKGDL